MSAKRGYEKLYSQMDDDALVREMRRLNDDWVEDKIPRHRVRRHRELMGKAEAELKERGLPESSWRLPEEPDIEF